MASRKTEAEMLEDLRQRTAALEAKLAGKSKARFETLNQAIDTIDVKLEEAKAAFDKKVAELTDSLNEKVAKLTEDRAAKVAERDALEAEDTEADDSEVEGQLSLVEDEAV